MRYAEYSFSPGLSPFVSGYWTFEKEAGEGSLDLDYAWPEAGGSLIVSLGDPVMGPAGPFPSVVVAAGIRTPIELRLPERARMTGFRFRAGGMRALLGLSPAEVGGVEALAGSWTRELAERLFALSDTDKGAAIALESALAAQLRRGETWARAARAEILFIRRLERADVPFLACEGRGSLRSLQRAWPEASGYCPCEYRAVLRCELARVALFSQPDRELSELALDLGFFDLPHFCRTFKRWSGLTPEGYRRFVEPHRARFPGWGSIILAGAGKDGA